MRIDLISLDNGHTSLEFDVSDIDHVSNEINRMLGRPKIERWPILTTYTYDGVRLVYQNEWDDPGLVAGDDAGDRILKALFDKLSQTSA